jgi:hypothetical protein
MACGFGDAREPGSRRMIMVSGFGNAREPGSQRME